MIRKEAWSFYKTISGVRLKDLKGRVFLAGGKMSLRLSATGGKLAGVKEKLADGQFSRKTRCRVHSEITRPQGPRLASPA